MPLKSKIIWKYGYSNVQIHFVPTTTYIKSYNLYIWDLGIIAAQMYKLIWRLSKPFWVAFITVTQKQEL